MYVELCRYININILATKRMFKTSIEATSRKGQIFAGCLQAYNCYVWYSLGSLQALRNYQSWGSIISWMNCAFFLRRNCRHKWTAKHGQNIHWICVLSAGVSTPAKISNWIIFPKIWNGLKLPSTVIIYIPSHHLIPNARRNYRMKSNYQTAVQSLEWGFLISEIS